MSHIALAQQAAEESMVLLKNKDGSGNAVLPLSRSKITKIAVIGAKVTYTLVETSSQDSCTKATDGTLTCSMDFSTNVRTGDNGSSRVFNEPAKSTGPLAGIMAAAGSGIQVAGYNTAAAAQSAGFDVAVVIAGLTPQDEGEEYTGAGDRTTGGTTATSHSVNFGLDPKANSGVQNGLITSVAAIGKPTIVVLEGGSVIDMPWLSAANVDAVIMAWYPGMVGGKALGRLLFGDVNFSGKLPLTWDTVAGRLADVRQQRAAPRRWTTGRVPLLRPCRQDATVPVRLWPVVHHVQVREPDGPAARRSPRTAPSPSPSTSPTTAPSPAPRRCSCSCSTRARRSPIARAPPTRS